MRAPLRNPGDRDYFGEIDEMYAEYDAFHELYGHTTREMLGMFMEDTMNRQEGKVAPDTAGADYFFLEAFVNEDMEYDFPYIERDFLRHCADKLTEYYTAAWYNNDLCRDSSPEEALRRKIMNMIFNGAKLGDPYCRELIKYLYKTYHKKEYNQLKRFKTIGMTEIFSLTEVPGVGCDYADMGRIVGMCCFMGIQLSEECSLLYLMLNREKEKWEAENDQQQEFEGYREGLLEECIQTVDTWREENRRGRARPGYFEKYWKDEEFLDACFRQCGYQGGYEYRCRGFHSDLRMDMSKTLAMLRTVFPRKEFTSEEVQQYTYIYSLVEALTQASDCFDEQIERLLGVDNYSMENLDKPLFKPENIAFHEKKPEIKKAEPVNLAPTSLGHAKAEDYLAEIAMLRQKLHEKEQENKYLREINRSAKIAEKDSQELINKLQCDREELIALREYAYKSAPENQPAAEAKTGIEEMRAAIAEKAVVIIGGHINWIQKLKQLFPHWLFVTPGSYKMVDGKMLENREHVYFFTDYLSHVSYVKFVAVVRQKKIPFGYLGSINLDSVIRRVYEDLVGG